MSENNSHRTPSYYVKKRLFNHKPAMFGLALIVFANIVAALGYLIMPDKTPDANDGSLYIKKKTPVFSVQMLKERKNMDIDETSFLDGIYFGKESEYTIFPLAREPKIENDSVFFVVYGEKAEIGLPLIQLVKPLFVGPAYELGLPSWPDSLREPYYVLGDTVHYINTNSKLRSISRDNLEREFKSFNLEDKTYWLGTDKSGRDMLSRLLAGTRISLSIGFISMLISLLLGVTMGATAGFFGGKIDDLIMWLMTVLWSIPSIMLVIIISIALQSKGVWVAFVAVGMTMWVDVARVVRGQILTIKEKLYIEAAKAFGISSKRIIFKHMLPNILGPLIVISTSNFAAAILIEAGLSFLGLGVQAPTPSWGIMINEGFSAIGTRDSWHLVLLPSLCIFGMVLAFNLFGNGLRDAYDPQNIK